MFARMMGLMGYDCGRPEWAWTGETHWSALIEGRREDGGMCEIVYSFPRGFTPSTGADWDDHMTGIEVMTSEDVAADRDADFDDEDDWEFEDP